jgi:RNA polymerase sigma factor (sigma-70 family)
VAPKRPGPEPCAALGDAQLVQRCLGKDEEAWRELLRRYSGLIYSVPLRRGVGRDLAEEVFHSVVATLAERLHLLADPTCLPKWLLVTTERRTTALAERDRRALDPPPVPAPEPALSPEAALAGRELERHLGEALGELDERDRELLLDLFYRGRPYAETALRLGLARGSLGALRARALARLRKVLERRGVL